MEDEDYNTEYKQYNNDIQYEDHRDDEKYNQIVGAMDHIRP